MYVCFLVSFSVLCMSGATDMLSSLWDEDDFELTASLRGKQLPEHENKILVGRLSKLPFSERLKSDVWYKLLRYRSVEKLDLTDWQTYEPLIPYLPLSLLGKVNFTDDEILSYFGRQRLSEFQLPQLAEEAMVRSGSVLDNAEELMKLGNIICGFTQKEMSTIKESVLRSLLEKNFFHSINACNPEKLEFLSKLVKQYTVVGPPRTWPPETVKRAGTLVAGLKPEEMREIRDKSFSEVRSEVIDLAPVEILMVIKDSQLRTLNKSALLSWRRKTRDLRALYKNNASRFPEKISWVTVPVVFLTIKWK